MSLSSCQPPNAPGQEYCIPMNNAANFVKILERLGNLNDDVPTQLLTKVCQPHYLMEQFASWAKFQDDVIVLAGFREVDQLHDMGVVNLPHDLNFFENICPLP